MTQEYVNTDESLITEQSVGWNQAEPKQSFSKIIITYISETTGL